ncbi:hypothetical protein NS263_10880 [Curtobacterium oceanosedimentum]|uniref:Uncharacterized protein n=1 Tax=Curtobacterium oceanosedimentum TaxID=465820 RepID=A0ABR5S871_9MICO|nr:hypothetical protein [Curtobacterium oceanosedimentum]KTR39273.1 hypothetical protein NS263_10880 [Curtobacterium oceanosedimentum]
MWITITSVGIAMVAAFIITTSVTAATKRSDRRRRERGEPLPNEGGALVTVRLRTFQWVLIRVVAIVFVVVGALLSLGAATTISTGIDPSLLIVAIVVLLAGIGGILLSRSLRRTRLLAMEDHLLVRQGLHQERRVDLREIAAVLPIANQYGGLQARDATGKRLFHVMGLARGYAELEAYLQERVVHPRMTAPAALGPNGISVPPWRGVACSADWTTVPLGSGGRVRPVIRLFVGGDVVVLQPAEVRALIDGRTAVVESDSQPLAFLASTALVAPTSLGGRQLAGLPPESLALLYDAQEAPAVVLRDGDAVTFRAWVSGLPR